MRHFMVDIETLGTANDSVVLSLGCVEFNEKGPIENEYGVNLQVREQLKMGRTMSIDTIEWWMDFGDRYPKHSRVDPLFALDEFVSMFPKDKEFMIWAKPPSFDIAMLENMLDMFKMPKPWDRRNIRDVYTVADVLTKVERDQVRETNENPHDAISDCKEQIELVVRSWRAGRSS
jgi:exodeoxyribonuclease VIII